ncbi:MAG TPA: DUF4760 domain-containing protein [Bryobacteraceae bacterium]|nr:DUF4760 domain-containing protein [Bryobacteraceae bacterium]
MATNQDADLILKLYELRREPKLREARDWVATQFRPKSAQDVVDTVMSEKGAYLRMVVSYWEMAAALVNHGSINAELFHDTNGEYLLVYAAIEPFIAGIREQMGSPRMFRNLEKLVQESPEGREAIAWWQARWKAEAEAKTSTANA